MPQKMGMGEDYSHNLEGEIEGTFTPEGERTSFSVLAQGKKTSCQSQNISMCPGINGTRLFQMFTILLLERGGGGGPGEEWGGGSN